MEKNELFGESHEQEENGLFGRMHKAEQLNLSGVSNMFFCGVKGGYCPMERKKDRKCLADFECTNQVTE
tara:strand:- start:192 stop:398 length:207 start_codon:yes stop_codon:yes gene_type:complete